MGSTASKAPRPFLERDDVDKLFGSAAVDAAALAGANEVFPRVYVGDISAALDPDSYVRFEFTHVVSCLEPAVRDVLVSNAKTAAQQAAVRVALGQWLALDFDDTDDTALAPHVARASPFITAALRQPRSRVLIHCAAGVSRSVSIVVAFLVLEHGLAARAALDRVQAGRPIANPNAGFRRQLLALERRRPRGVGMAAWV